MKRKDGPINPDDLHFEDSIEILKRKKAMDHFVGTFFEPELRPIFVSDEATIFDVTGDPADEIIEKIDKHYGVHLTVDQLRMPLWKLLDFLG
jgi:hypothetical protein